MKRKPKKYLTREQILRVKDRPVRIRSHRYGQIRLKHLAVLDLDFVGKLAKKRLSARDFCTHLINHQIVSPDITLDEITAWPDRLLARAVTAWIQSEINSDFKAEQNASAFGLVEGEIQSFIKEQLKQLQDFAAPARQLMKNFLSHITFPDVSDLTNNIVGASMTPVFEQLSTATAQLSKVGEILGGNIARMAAVRAPTFDFGKLVQSLPRLSELLENAERVEEAKKALETEGFSFTGHVWADVFYQSLPEYGPRIQAAAVTNKLLAVTRSNTFESSLASSLRQSTIAGKRSEVVFAALKAHGNRDYILSIPVLLSQVEGLFTDALILNDMAIKSGGNIYARESDGTIKKERGQKVRLTGLHGKVQHSRYRGEEVMRTICGTLLNGIVGTRNAILHGSSTKYGKAKLSVQLTLLIYVLVKELAAFETGGKP